MTVKDFHIKYFSLAMIILFASGVYSQKETDSILSIARQQIYENPDRAIEIAKDELNKSRASADDKVQASLIISTAYSSKREYKKSLDYTLAAMDLLPNLKDGTLKINLLNRIGGQYQELKIYEKAILYLDKARKLIEDLPEGPVKSKNLGINNVIRGFIYREQMSCDIALTYFDKAIEDFKKNPETAGIKANISTSYYNRGNCLINLVRLKDAEASFLQSINYAKKEDAKSLVAFAQKGLAEVYTVQGVNKEAISLLKDALENSEEVGDKVLNRALYNALAINYLAMENLEKYSYYKNKNIEIDKQLTKTERKTIDDSINNLLKTTSEEIKTIQNRTKIIQLSLIVLVILNFIFIIRFIFKTENNLKSLKEKLTL